MAAARLSTKPATPATQHVANDRGVVVDAEDDEAQVRMAPHQAACDVRFSLAGQRQIHDNQVGLERRDRILQGPLVRHHQHGLEQGIEQAVNATQHAQMTIRQKDAAMFHGTIQSFHGAMITRPPGAQIQAVDLPARAGHAKRNHIIRAMMRVMGGLDAIRKTTTLAVRCAMPFTRHHDGRFFTQR